MSSLTTAHGPIRHAAARITTLLAAVALLLGLGAGTALAHVTVNPSDATAGGYAKLTFRVPNESPDASTVSLTVELPRDTPFPSVSLQPVPGWTAQSETVSLDPPVTTGKFTLDKAVGSITWTADDGVGIAPGQFQEFAISVGPVPDVPRLIFPATQTYSDGEVVQWADVAEPGQDPHSLDHPAPILTVGSPAGHGEHLPDSFSARSTSTDATAQLLGALGLALGAVALVLSVLALKRSGRRSPAAARQEDQGKQQEQQEL